MESVRLSWILVLMCLVFQLHPVKCKVKVGVTIDSFSNVNGTAYVEFSSDRKCCDGAQRADCASGDTCDTYIYICITERVGLGWTCSDGASFETQVFNNTNSLSHLPEMTAVANTWQSQGMTLFALIRDDDTRGLLQASDHIDTLTQSATFSPDPSDLAAQKHNFIWTGTTSLSIEVRAWCADDYYGANCGVHCQELDPVVTCDSDGTLICNQRSILLIKFSDVTTNDQFPALDLGLNQFFEEQVCHSNTSSVFYPQLNANTNTLTFTGYCGNQELQPLQFEEIIMTSQEEMLRHYFSPGVQKGANYSIQGYGEHITPNVKVGIEIVNVAHPSGTSHDGSDINSTLRCCDVTSASNCQQQTDTCDLQFTFCLGKFEQQRCVGTVLMSRVYPDTLAMQACGPSLMDSTKGIVYPTTPMIGAFHLTKAGELIALKVVVEDNDNMTSSSDIIDVLGSAISVHPGSTILAANGTDVRMKNLVELSIRLTFWCAPGHSGSSCTPDNGTEHCQQGWQGDDCDVAINPCSSSPCHNGATCYYNSTGYFCTCTPGYHGNSCDIDVDECLLNICRNGATCQNLPGAFNCICAEGWGGLICTDTVTQCSPTPCLHGGQCVARPDMPDQYVCQCRQGWIGRNCETPHVCSHETCLHGNCSQLSGDVFCVCNSGFRGDNCTEDIDECIAHPCLNSGQCSNTYGGFNCSCRNGYYGQRCENKTTMCKTVTCQNNGTCIEARLDLLGFRCLCHHGFTGTLCESVVNPCQNVSCNNRGYCINTDNDFYCNCSNFWTGKICDVDVNECSTRVCQNSVGCTNSPGSYQCKCKTGWTGKNCDIDIDECLSTPCNNGNCINTPGSFKCNCTSGYTGSVCNVTSLFCQGHQCSGHGVCYDTNNSYVCRCNTGYQGLDCDKDVDECALGVCGTNAINCTNSPGSFLCACKTGWEGSNCTVDVDECASSNMPCSGNGLCRNLHGGYTCQCFPGFNGSHCKYFINTCSNLKCNNNGTCKVTPDGPKCVCSKGWDGITCSQDVNECEDDMPCQHSGKCVNTDGSFYCDCAGWTGRSCQTDVNECMTSVCQNGGVCANQPGGYTCGCQDGWLGMSCEVPQLSSLDGYILEFDFGLNITSDRKQPLISYVYQFLNNRVCNGTSSQLLIRSAAGNVLIFTAMCGGVSVTKATIELALDAVSKETIFLLPLKGIKQTGEPSSQHTQEPPTHQSWPTVLGVTLAVVFVGAVVGAAVVLVRRKRLTDSEDEAFNNPMFSASDTY